MVWRMARFDSSDDVFRFHLLICHNDNQLFVNGELSVVSIFLLCRLITLPLKVYLY